MVKVILKPQEDGQKTVEIPTGKTVIGRGPFLGCGDKKVSRNHAILEVSEDGDIYLTPTHVNPCFYRPTGDNPGTVLKKDKAQKLESGDTFSLLPRSFRYQVIVISDKSDKSPENNSDSKISEKANGSTDEKKDDPSTQSKEDILIQELPKTAEPVQSNKEVDKESKENEEKVKPVTTEVIVESSPNAEKENSKVIVTNDKEEIKSTEIKTADEKDNINGTVITSTVKSEESKDDRNVSASTPQKKRTLPNWLLKIAATPQKYDEKRMDFDEEEEEIEKDEFSYPSSKRNRDRQPSVKRRGGVNTQTKRRTSRKEFAESEEDMEFKERPNRTTGRSSRQNRQTRQGLSLEDFIVSDDDEWASERSDPKPKRRRGQRRGDESGSDWEAEHRKKRKSRRADTDSESGSDWEMSRKKKTPNKPKRRRNKRVPASDVSEEEITVEKPSTSTRKGKRLACTYGKKCYRKNTNHLEQFSHPGDPDYTSEPESQPAEEDASGGEDDGDDRPECQYGLECFRKNVQHRKEYKHTKKVRPQREAAKLAGKKAKSGDDDDAEPNSCDFNDSLVNDESDEFQGVLESGSDWNPEADSPGEDFKGLVKEAKGFMKNKKTQKQV